MILDTFRLEGKCGLITGAGSGIGRAMAHGLAAAGAKVAIAGRDMAKLEKARDLMTAEGFQVVALPVDMNDPVSIRQLTKTAVDRLGRLDFLFNNAGMISRASSEEFPLAVWEEMVRVNLTGPFILSQEVANQMIADGIRGSIVNTSSLIAVFGGMNVPAYAATKGGITQLTKAMCNDLGKYGIRVNAIGPGWVKTEMTEALQKNSDRYQAIISRIPLARWAEPEDLAPLAVFLASDASAYINGQVIFIDGGYMAM